jgi:hypothetical protein
MEQGEIDFLLGQHWQEIGKRGEDGETHTKAVAILSPKKRDLADDLGPRHVSRKLAEHPFSDDEADILCEAVSSRSRQCPTGSACPKVVFTQTSPLRTSTGQIGASSAHRSKVQPLSRSNRAWCQ